MTWPTIDLSLALGGMPAPGAGRPELDAPAALRALVPWAARAGYRAVQLDAAAAGLRPRELGRSARRDLAATLRRATLSCSGVDLWIPAAHFADPARSDRAMSAAIDSMDFAAELASLTGGRAVVSMALGWRDAPGACEALVSAAEDRAVRLADHAWPGDDRSRWVGIDPAVVLASGQPEADPASGVSRAGGRLASVRLSDLSEGGHRVSPGSGRVDLVALLVAATTLAARPTIVADLRGVEGALRCASELAVRLGASEV